VDTATATTSTINWGLSSIVASGYAGTTGAPGTNGTNGVDGLSSRICYAKSTVNPLSSTPATVTVAGSGTFPPYNTWGGAETWVATPMALAAGEFMYQSDGIYNPSTGNTVWNVPYLSNLKVGSLSAISANMGTITAGDLSIGSSPTLSGTTMTGTGSHLYATGNFAFGNPTTNMVFDGSNVYLNGFADNTSSNNNGVTTFNNYDTVSFQTFDITKASQATYGIAGNQRIGTNNLTVVSLRFIMYITLRQSMPATSIVAGQGYIVRTIGTTNYTTCGGTNTVGRFFTATATPTGSGTVWPETALLAVEREIWATPGRFSSSLQLTGGFSFSSTKNFALGTYDICLSQSYAEGYTAAGNAVVGAVLYSSASAVSSFIFASRI
jgi:hypothetical protein